MIHSFGDILNGLTIVGSYVFYRVLIFKVKRLLFPDVLYKMYSLMSLYGILIIMNAITKPNDINSQCSKDRLVSFVSTQHNTDILFL